MKSLAPASWADLGLMRKAIHEAWQQFEPDPPAPESAPAPDESAPEPSNPRSSASLPR